MESEAAGQMPTAVLRSIQSSKATSMFPSRRFSPAISSLFIRKNMYSSSSTLLSESVNAIIAWVCGMSIMNCLACVMNYLAWGPYRIIQPGPCYKFFCPEPCQGIFSPGLWLTSSLIALINILDENIFCPFFSTLILYFLHRYGKLLLRIFFNFLSLISLSNINVRVQFSASRRFCRLFSFMFSCLT